MNIKQFIVGTLSAVSMVVSISRAYAENNTGDNVVEGSVSGLYAFGGAVPNTSVAINGAYNVVLGNPFFFQPMMPSDIT